jgi:hypothetical protein
LRRGCHASKINGALNETSAVVVLWWASLSVISVVNVVLWIRLARRYQRDRDTLAPQELVDGKRQLALSGVYVFVCAFRSFVPRADVQRICFVDHFVASVFVGRTVATLAEIAFMTQLVWTARRLARSVDARSVLLLVTLPLPMILIAETTSWYAVLTTNFVGNFIEQSLWMLSGVLLGIGLLLMRRRCAGPLRRLMTLCATLALVFFAFMALVDTRMYLARLRADELSRHIYLGFSDGLTDCMSRRVVTFAWRDWHEELAWMFLYFSVTVWLSLFLAGLSHRPLPAHRDS